MIEDSRKAARVRRTATGFALLLLVVLAVACSNSNAEEEAGNFSGDPETAKVQRIVRDYVINHPEILDEAVRTGQRRQMAKLVNEVRSDIETPFPGAWAGARDGDVVLVEFFDYACPYCKATNADVNRLLSEDRNLKVVWREWPVLGDNSMTAAQASLAAARQGRYRQFFDRLFEIGRPTPEAISQAQKAAGVTPIQTPEFTQEIDKNHELAQKLGGTGTPLFVVGDRILHGAVGYDALKEAIAEARKKA